LEFQDWGRAWLYVPVIPITWEIEIREIVVQGQPRKTVSETFFSTNK
jgi:hypothetical protein